MTVPDYSAAKVLPIDWDRLHRDTLALGEALRPLGPFRGLVAVSRGGLVPAGILSIALDIKLVETVCVSTYDGRRRHDPSVIKPAEEHVGQGLLVIDDLVDTGATAEVVRAMMPGAHYAVVYAKPEGRPLADTHAVEIDQDVWLSFPWEAEAAEGVSRA